MMNNLLGIIGILFTIFFGIPAIVAIRNQYHRKIIFFQEDLINLHDRITKNIPDLRITFRKKLISSHLFLIKGFIFCKGKNDIKSDDIEQNLYFELPQDSIWHDYKVIDTSKDLQVNLRDNENKLNIEFGLFKNAEYIYLEGLFESSETEKVGKNINIFHRIANVGKVELAKVASYKTPIQDLLKPFYIMAPILITFFTILPFEIDLYNLEPIYFENGIETSNNINQFTVGLDDARELAIKEYTYLDLVFNKKTKEYQLKQSGISARFFLESKFDFYVFIFSSSLTFLLFTMFFIMLIDYFNKRPLLKIIKEKSHLLKT